MGRRKTTPMSMEEHRELAAKLKRFEVDAWRLYQQLAHTNLFTKAKLNPLVRMSPGGLDTLCFVRSELENHSFREHPGEASIHLYYGGNKD